MHTELSIVSLVANASLLVQAVMALLMVVSLLSWTTIFRKWFQIREARVVPDIERDIVEAVNALRARYDYVFTTGGIGPTHDDITADCIAKAFGVGISEHPEAVARMTKHYGDVALFTPARRRMARVPQVFYLNVSF